jgi:hypothetical protein
MIAQPGVAILEPFALDANATERDVCPVEAAILRSLRDTCAWSRRQESAPPDVRRSRF